MLNKKDVIRINDNLQDKFFSLKELTLDSGSRTWVLPFENDDRNDNNIVSKGFLKKELKKQVFRSQLVITNVDSYEIQDKAKINRYSFESIQLDDKDATSTLVIKCSPNLEMKVILSNDAEVRVDNTDTLLGVKTITYFMGIEINNGKVDQ